MISKIEITQWLEDLFKALEFQDCFLVDVNFALQNQKIQVFLDADNGLGLDRCAHINRLLVKEFAEKGIDEYTLEVSSPGLDKPIRLERQLLKNVGRKLIIKKNDGGEMTGILELVKEDYLVLKRKAGNKKKKIENSLEINRNEIKEIFVGFSFK